VHRDHSIGSAAHALGIVIMIGSLVIATRIIWRKSE
jgi:hypothetical protein